ncbi:MAG TPA: tRNA pseudouridine(38-40) synthase TruA [Acidimicrobiia bacterium]|nr:tRNA pseudouridine(38-40) synthase TruA [Acidimicrobiia bacterium]
MPTYRLDLAYDGSGFHGYARQPNVRTVQGALEAALAPWIGPADTHVAGRTDRGVHASGQVVSFTCDEIDTHAVTRSLNSQLAPAIAVRSITQVEDGFHARFSATGRAYRYCVRNSPVHDPFTASVTWTYADALDVEAMHDGVQNVVGEHDFAAFCRKQGDRTTVRVVEWAWWKRSVNLVELSIGGRSFCHQMVRSIVAVSIEVGRGRLDPQDVGRILVSGDRSTAKGVAPPHGLTLVAVAYGDEPLPRPAWVPETS